METDVLSIGSLEEELKGDLTHDRRLYVLEKLADRCTWVDSSKALVYAENGVRLASELGDKEWLARMYVSLALVRRVETNLPQVRVLLLKALKIAEELEDKPGLKAKVLCKLGRYHCESSANMEEGKKCFLKSLELAEVSGDESVLQVTLHSLGEFYCNYGAYLSASIVLYRGLAISEKRKKLDFIASFCKILMRVYISIGDNETALFYGKKSLDYSTFESLKLMTYLNLGVTFSNLGKLSEAEICCNKAIEISKINTSIFDRAQVLIAYADILYKREKYEQVLSVLDEAEELCRVIGNDAMFTSVQSLRGRIHLDFEEWEKGIELIEYAIRVEEAAGVKVLPIRYKLLAQAYEAIGNIEDSFSNYKKYIESGQQALKSEVSRVLASFQMESELNVLKKARDYYSSKADALEKESAFRSKELEGVSLQFEQSSKALDQLRAQLLSMKKNEVDPELIQELENAIIANKSRREGWDTFSSELEILDQDLMDRLRSPAYSLTPTELRVCTLLNLNLSNKEISSLLEISARTVDTHRTRIRKKLGLKRNENLVRALSQV